MWVKDRNRVLSKKKKKKKETKGEVQNNSSFVKQRSIRESMSVKLGSSGMTEIGSCEK